MSERSELISQLSREEPHGAGSRPIARTGIGRTDVSEAAS
jgi:hypothetical protein